MSNVLKMLFRGGAAAAETDPNFNQTVLLLHGDGTNGAQNNTFLDSSTNNFTITRNGNTTQGTFSPFSADAGKWSNYFDGSGDYLSASANSAFDFGSGDFTVEAWVYLAGNSLLDGSSRRIANIFSVSTSSVFNFNFIIFGNSTTTGTGLEIYNGSNIVNVAGTINQNTWNHIAVSKSGTSVYFWLNGTQLGSTQTTSGNWGSSANGAQVGRSLVTNYTFDLNGYISNVRVLKGTALYTSAFTPSTTPLTAITNTSLLTCQSNRFVDNSTNAFAITRNGDVRVTPFSPFAPTAAYSAGTNGGSGYFDGSGDYLTLPSGAAFQFNTGDFCVEVWFYPTATLGSGYIIDARNSGQTGTWSLAFGYGGTSGQLNWGFNGSVVANGGTTNVIQNAWNHIVYSRSGTSGGLFVNGIRVANPTDSNNYNVAPTTSYIAVRYSADSPNFITGYLVTRVVKGSFVYDPTQTTLTVPTAPPTAITNTSLLCNFTNAGIIDNTGKNVLETVGNAQIDTTTKKYGTGSLEFDGTGDYLKIPSSPLVEINGSNFTMEFWVRFNSVGGDAALISKYANAAETAGGQGYLLQWVQSTAVLRLVLGNNPGGADQLYTWSWSPSINVWYHVAVTRSGTSGRAFVDGTQIGSTLTLITNDVVSPNALQIGKTHTVSQYLNGFIDDLRITKGVARYTSNFTPPIKELPNQ